MADERPPPQDVRVVDFLNNTVLDLPDSESFRHFVDQIQEVSQGLNVLNANMEKATEAQLKLAKFYEGGGHSINASRHFETQASRPETRPSERSETASTPPIEVQERSMREMLTRGRLGSVADEFMRRRPFHRTDVNVATSEMDVDAMGGQEPIGGGGGGRSSGASHRGNVIRDDWARLEAKMPLEPLRMPRAGEFTAQNLLETGAQFIGERAQMWRERGMRSAAATEFPDASAAEIAELAADPTYQAELGPTGPGPNALRTGSEWLYFAAEQAPKAALLHQYTQMAGYDFGPGGTKQIGVDYGESARDGWKLGPVQIPYTSSAGRRGISEQWDAFKEAAFTPALTNKDINYFKEQAAERGYYSNDERFNAKWQREQYVEAGKQMLKKKVPDSVVFNEKTWDLFDKQTRFGTKSLTDFVNTMGRVKTASDKASVSFDQLLMDMDAIGELNQAQGGTHAQGQRLALSIAEQMGLPPGPIGEALANPLVQGRAFRDTGLMNMEQGLMNPGERVGSLLSSVQETYGALSELGPQSRKAPGLAGELGGKLSYSDRDRKIAMLHQMYPELSPEILKAMTGKDAKGLQAGAQTMMMGEAWSTQVGNTLGKMKGGPDIWGNELLGSTDQRQIDTLTAMFDPRSGKGGKFTWGDQEKLMKKATYWDEGEQRSKKMFSEDDLESIREAGEVDVKSLKEGGLTKSEQQQIREAASGRYNRMREIMKDKSGDLSKGPKVTIELGPAAKKAFNLRTPWGNAKDEAQKGAGAVNVYMGEGSLGVPGFGEGYMGTGGPVPGGG